jgi:oligoribonuclease NrnB/cAMP/cGMP phosphodiesterase (DHH superfamily)
LKIFHHNDPDGRLAAYWVLKSTQDMVFKYFVKLYEMNYSIEFPLDEIKKDEYVYIVDFSIPVETMKKLQKITENVFWIDHHISAIEDYAKGYEGTIAGLQWGDQKFKIGGCALTWMFFNTDSTETMEERFAKVPRATQLVSDYDTWTFKFGDTTHYAVSSIASYDHSPKNKFWDDFHNDTEKYVEMGEHIFRYNTQRNKEINEQMGFDVEFEGYKCRVLNTKGNSLLFGDDIKKYNICIMMYFDGKLWNYSLYSHESSKIDTSKISKKYGGGGHPSASGFTAKKNLFQ